MTGMIFNIQKCSIHDGNGLRTLVFMKGCPLRCSWCANPESQTYTQEIMESPVKCIGCGYCAKACNENAIGKDGKIDREKCSHCMKCTDTCFAEAKRTTGKEYTIDELYREIEKDKAFFGIFGGGVTFSGGEPLSQAEYLAEIAKKCKAGGINVTVESCGYAEFDKFESALPYIDSMFMDIKLMDSEKHKQYTGKSNEKILENIRRISEYGIPIIIRTPIVPGYTDDPENIRAISRFIAELPSVREYELLTYHNLGESKYKSLGRKYELEGVQSPSDEDMRELVKISNDILTAHGKECFWTKNNNKEAVR